MLARLGAMGRGSGASLRCMWQHWDADDARIQIGTGLTLGERQIRQCALVKSDRGYARSRPEARAPMEWCELRRSPKQPSSLARRSAAPHVQATLTHDQAAAPAPYAAAWPRSRCQFLGDSTRSSEY